MKRILLSAIVVATGLSSNVLFAETKSLIDFNQYEQKLAAEPSFAQGGQNNNNANAAPQNDATTNQSVGQGGEGYKISVEDMKLDHWLVLLNSSSRQIQNIQYSYAKAVKTKGKVGGGPRTVLGARIHFPEWPNNSYAEIAPPYDFPVYTEAGVPASIENGVIGNVGDLYSITAEVYGRNFKNAFYIQLRNEFGALEKYFLGYLYYNGWRKLTWKNPMYIDNVDLRQIVRLPIFPDKGLPYKKFDSFLVFRQGYDVGGDFLVYVANISMTYDLAVVQEDEDIDEEGTWNILAAKLKEKASIENSTRQELAELRLQALKKMAVVKGVPVGSINNGANNGGQATTPAGAQQPAPAAEAAAPAAQ
jgi:hypothetical protein